MPGSEELLVRVTHAGLNPADLSQREGSYPAPPGSPQDIPGLEVAGTVEACGAQVLGWKPGDRVFGLVGGGGLADRVVVHERHVAAVPDSLDEPGAAAVPEAFITAHDAIRTQAALTWARRCSCTAPRAASAAPRCRSAVSAARACSERCAARTQPRSCASSAASRSPTRASPIACWRRPTGAGRTSSSSSSARRTSPTTSAPSPCWGGSWSSALGAGADVALVLRQLMARRASMRGTMLRARTLEQKAQAVRAFERELLPHLASGRLRPVIDSVIPYERAGDAFERMAASGKRGKVLLHFT